MEPVTTAALISGGASLISGGANAISTGKMNKKNREFSREMYNLNVLDNRKNWDLQNAYNHPVEQMKRLTEAGLNPALIYGGGSGSFSAGSVSSASPRPTAGTPPQLDLNAVGVMGSVLAAKRFELDQKLTEANIAKINAETARIEAENPFAGEIAERKSIKLGYEGGVAHAKQILYDAQTENILNRTEIDRYMKEPNRDKALADIAYKVAATNNFQFTQENIQSMIKSREFQNAKTAFETHMLELGVGGNSNFMWRAFATWMDDAVKKYNNTIIEDENKRNKNADSLQPMPLLK
jgi:hypothetical protein